MSVDLDELERLAKAADCWGRWAIWPDLKAGGFIHVGNADGLIPEGEIATPDDAEPNPIAKCYTPEIAEFIAATDPTTVLALVARLRKAEARIEKVRTIHKPFRYYEHEDSCPNHDEDHRAERHVESEVGEYYCEDMPTGDVVCDYCRDEDGERADWPCETVKALTEGDEK